MKLYLSVFLVLSFPFESVSFGLVSPRQSRVLGTSTRIAGIDGRHPTLLFETADSKDGDDDSKEAEPQLESMTQEEKEEVVGNLVADDEWNGLALELSELVRVAIVEDLKKNTREFTGKDDYKVGDISKELDARVKDEVANFRGKDEYELGDLTIALDTLSKDLTCELTGKSEYEFGDLSREIDKRVKSAVADFCGKDSYEFGDLSTEISKRVANRVQEFTGNDDYEFGDISRAIEERREQWVSNYLGKDASDYQFGDITKKFLSDYTGKGDDYQFGDATKKFVGDLFGGKKKKGGGK